MNIKTTVAGLLFVASAFYGNAAYADSDDSCGGNLIEVQKAIAPNGNVVGYLQLYYNGQNGLNCAVFRHSDATWNKPLYTYAQVHECLNKGCTSTSTAVEYKGSDYGVFKFAAGPVRQPGRNKCIQAFGYIDTNKNDRGFSDSTVSVKTRQHCD